MKLRQHQSDFLDIIDRIIQGEPITRVIAHITPGGGKSLIALLSCRLIKEGFADRLCWVVPRLTLAHQAELNFIEYRLLISHGMTIRSAMNEIDPCRDQVGYTVTYQSLAADKKCVHIKEFLKRRYILLIDENHHAAADDSAWGLSLGPMVEHASFVFFLSGTLARGDEKKIAFMPYIRTGNAWRLDFRRTEDTEIIAYSRSEALRERAILPLNFTLFDGEVTWEDKNGATQSSQLSSSYDKTGQAIYTALNTEFADSIIDEGLKHWTECKAQNPRSKLAVVAANIKHAKGILKKLNERGFQSEIATSEDTPSAIKAIKAFRGSDLDIMVFVAMCSEGLDIPPLTHIICLTHVRSTVWIEQLVARSVRIDPQAGPYESQRGYIFAPDDPLFRRVVDQIKKEQLPIVRESEGERGKPGEGTGESRPDVIPINGNLTGKREISLGSFSQGSAPPDIIETISDREVRFRELINKHVLEFSFRNYYKSQRINTEIVDHFGKYRDQMTLKELQACLKYVEYNYPVNGKVPAGSEGSKPRGKGRRVPTKAEPWQIPLF